MVLAAFIKQEVNIKELYSILDRIGSEDINERITVLRTDSKAKTSQLSDLVNKTKKASDELRLLSDVNEKLEGLNNDSKVKTLLINEIERKMNQTSDDLFNLHLNMTSSNSESEKLLHDLMNDSRTDIYDKLENINNIFGILMNIVC